MALQSGAPDWVLGLHHSGRITRNSFTVEVLPDEVCIGDRFRIRGAPLDLSGCRRSAAVPSPARHKHACNSIEYSSLEVSS